LGVLLSTAASRSRADTGSDKAAAEALFDEGRKLLAAGRFAEACAKLEASQRLDSGVGTLLNLADCYEKSGKTASAWAEFREASAAARKAGSKEREDIARKRATLLEAKLSYLTISVPDDQVVSITRNGAAVDEALLGTAIPVDPGQHLITASAPGKQSWSSSVRVAPLGDRATLRVPRLRDEGAAASLAVPKAAQAQTQPWNAAPELAGPTPSPSAASGSNPGATQRLLALISAGVGVAGIGVGTGFGLHAAARWSSAKRDCMSQPDGPRICGDAGLRDGRAAMTSATISTVAFVVGGAGIAGALVLWLSAPSAVEKQTALALGPESVTLWGTF
jgi:hypothetical protein